MIKPLVFRTSLSASVSREFADMVRVHAQDNNFYMTTVVKAALELWLEVPREIQQILYDEQAGELFEKPPSIKPKFNQTSA